MKTITEETETKDQYSRTTVTTTEGDFEAVEYINFKDGEFRNYQAEVSILNNATGRQLTRVCSIREKSKYSVDPATELEINWSALGAVPKETARQFAELLLFATKIAEASEAKYLNK